MYRKIGVLPIGQIGKLCKSVVDHYGEEMGTEMWEAYITIRPYLRFGEVDPDHYDVSGMGPADFAKTAGLWFDKCQPIMQHAAANGRH